MSTATAQLEKEIDRLQRVIDQDPNDDEMLKLANKISSDHDKVQHALNYARLPDKDRKKLKKFISETTV